MQADHRFRRLVRSAARVLAGSALAFALVAATATTDAAAQQRRHDAPTGCVGFTEYGFEGGRIEFAHGARVPRLRRRADDRMLSVRVDNGCRLLVFSEHNYKGAQGAVTAHTPRLGGVFDRGVSSAVCRCNGAQEFETEAVFVPGGRRDDRPGGGGGRPGRPPDRLNPNGIACIAFEGRDFRGAWREFEDDRRTSRLGARLAGDVGSIRVARGCVAELDIGPPFKLLVEDDARQIPAGAERLVRGVACYCRR